MPDADPLLAIDPFILLMDARHQLFSAIDAVEGGPEGSTEAGLQRIAVALGVMVAHDRALTDVVHALSEGSPPLDEVAPPEARRAPATREDAQQSRSALLESLGNTRASLDTEVAVPWTGRETWHVHLVGLAMLEGAQAHALRTGEPLPASL